MTRSGKNEGEEGGCSRKNGNGRNRRDGEGRDRGKGWREEKEIKDGGVRGKRKRGEQ